MERLRELAGRGGGREGGLLKYGDLDKAEGKPAASTEGRASKSLIEWLTFSYLSPLLEMGYKRPLVFEDLPELARRNTADGIGSAFADAWDEQLSLDRPSLFKALWKVEGTDFLWGNAYKDALVFVAPVLLQEIIAFIDPATTAEEDLEIWRGPMLVILLFISQCSQSLFLHRYFDKVYHCGMQARTGLMCLVFRKSMSLSSQVMNGDDEHNIGNIINMMQVDVSKCIEFLPFSSNLLWSSPVQILVSLAMLWRLVGPASLAGFATILAVMPINAISVNILEKIQERNMAEKDKRIRTLSEILNGIKVLKMFAWEAPAASNVHKIRAAEVTQLRRCGYQMALQGILWQSTPALVALAIFGTYTAMGNTLSLSTALPVLSLINILKFPLTVLPWMLMSWVSFKISLARLEKFLLLQPLKDVRQLLPAPQMPLRIRRHSSEPGGSSGLDSPKVIKANGGKSEIHRVSAADTDVGNGDASRGEGGENGSADRWAAGGECGPAIELQGVTLSWKGGQGAVVSDVSFSVRRGELVVIMGDVGSGKSSLLSGILGEMNCEAGTIAIQVAGARDAGVVGGAALEARPNLAYVPQVAWILDTTLRENIVMGKPWDAKAYRRAVHAAGLLPDLEVLPNGDETSIGERGVCLSGGQKQRVSLARAIYADADIYLLDDPLSAVDGHVAAHIYSECIHGAIEHSTRVLVTHRAEVVRDAHHVIVLKGGRIAGEGTWEELEAKGLILEPEKNLSRSGSTDADVEQVAGPESQEGEFNVQQPAGDASYLSSGALNNEERKTGTVDAKTWRVYFAAIGHRICTTIALFAVATQAMTLTLGWCIAQWAAADTAPLEQRRDEEVLREGSRGEFLGLYSALTAAQVFATLFRDAVFVVGTAKAASFLHNRMLASILRTPLSFFDTTPSGVVLNRFSKDCDTADSALPNNIHTILTYALDILGPLCLVGMFTPSALILSLPLFYLYLRVQRYYRCTCRELKRIESLIRSPIYSHFAQSLDGVISVRAYSLVDAFKKHHEKLVDSLNAVYWPMTSLNRWLGLRLECIGAFIIALTGGSAIVLRIMGSVTHESGALLALTVTFVLGITHEMGWMVRQTSEAEANMNCVERMDEYSRLPSEPPEEEADDSSLPTGWPLRGEVKFEEVCLRYRPELPLVLDQVSFTIDPGHKVGVCGRTGAGKSSLITMLLRLVPPESGRVCIDGKDISRVGVKTLRSRLAIVPQDPIIYTGTLRYNMDPFNQFTDAQLQEAVKMVRLDHKITCLNQEVGQGGGELSVGERQLLCTARALLRKARIVLLDEATASVDVGTDQALQKALRLEGEGRTVITVAHRLNTIMDYDKVLVMAEGRVVEYANPRELASDCSSAFAGLLSGRRVEGPASRETSPLRFMRAPSGTASEGSESVHR